VFYVESAGAITTSDFVATTSSGTGTPVSQAATLVSNSISSSQSTVGALAATASTVVGSGTVTGAVLYTGPGDIVSGATAWWGLRAYSSAVRGTNAVRLRRSSDNVEQDFATLPAGGLDTAAIATFASGSSLYVVTLYDQTGNGYTASQSTVGNQPLFSTATLVPSIYFDRTVPHYLTMASALPASLPRSLVAVVNPHLSGNYGTIVSNAVSGAFMFRINNVNTVQNVINFIAILGSSTLVVPPDLWTSVAAAYDGSVSHTFVMAGEEVISVSNTSTTGINLIGNEGGGTGGTYAFGGYMLEVSCYGLVLTAANASALNANSLAFITSSSYFGPMDISPRPKTWWGLRAGSPMSIANNIKVIRVRASGDNVETDIGLISSGDLDQAAVTSFIATHGGTAFVVKIYDQTASVADMIQSTAANQPVLLLNGGNNKPAVQFTRSSAQLMQAGVTISNQPEAESIVAEYINDGLQSDLIGDSAGSVSVIFNYGGSNPNQLLVNAGTSITYTATDGVYHRINVIYNGGSGAIMLDGTDNSSQNFGTNSMYAGVVTLGGIGGVYFNGNVRETGIYDTIVGFNRAGLDSNQLNYWGSAPVTTTGTGVLSAQSSIAASTGVSISLGSGVATAGSVAISASAVSSSVGTGALLAGSSVLTSSAKGSSIVTGTPAAGVSALVSSGTGSWIVTGTLTVGVSTLASSGVGSSVGTGILTAGASVLTSSGIAGNVAAGTGTLAAGVSALTSSGVGGSVGTGTFAAGVSALTSSGVGSSVGTGILAAGVSALVSSAKGSSVVTGTPAAGVSALISTGIGSSVATGALASQSSSLAGVASVLAANSGVLISQSSVIAGVANAIIFTTGTGTLAAQTATTSGAGLSKALGTAVLTTTNSLIVASSVSSSSAIGSVVVSPALIAGSGISRGVGTGALISQAAVVAGVGSGLAANSGVLTAQSSVVAGVANAVIVTTGTGALVAQVATASGAGTSRALATAALAAANSSIVASAVSNTPAVGSVVAASAMIAGVGFSRSISTGILIAQNSNVAGVGLSLQANSGAMVPRPAIIAGQAITKSIGSGILSTGAVQISGVSVSSWRASGALVTNSSQIHGIGVDQTSGIGVLDAYSSFVFGSGASRNHYGGVYLNGVVVQKVSFVGCCLNQKVSLTGTIVRTINCSGVINRAVNLNHTLKLNQTARLKKAA
jgi:hypothetical protein